MRFPLASSSFAAALIAAALATSPVVAGTISGSDTVGAGVTSTNEGPGNLGTTTTVLLSSADLTFSVFGVGAGDFSVIPMSTMVPLASSTLDFSNMASFDFTSATVGTFAATSILVYDKTPTTVDVFLTGTFAPGSLFPAGSTAPLGASETLAFTQTNAGVISLLGTFASPPAGSPVPVPEPMTLSLVGAGLIGMGAMRRRKKKPV